MARQSRNVRSRMGRWLLGVGVAALLAASYLSATIARHEVTFSTASTEELLDRQSDIWGRVSSISWGHRDYRTRFSALWTREGLGLRFVAFDPSPWFTMTRRDEPIWNEEVVEIFLDLDGSGTHYAEYELNPNNTLSDLEMLRGVPNVEGNIEWNHAGARHRVWLLGGEEETLGWEARLFLPWEGFASLPSSRERSYPPEPGESFRFNVFRIERPGGSLAPRRDVLFMPYIPTGNPSFHVPEVFQELVFVESSRASTEAFSAGWRFALIREVFEDDQPTRSKKQAARPMAYRRALVGVVLADRRGR